MSRATPMRKCGDSSVTVARLTAVSSGKLELKNGVHLKVGFSQVGQGIERDLALAGCVQSEVALGNRYVMAPAEANPKWAFCSGPESADSSSW